MTTLLEVVRYGVPDGEGDIFQAGCFGLVDGVRIRLSKDFDARKPPIGYGVLREKAGALERRVTTISKATINEIALIQFGSKTRTHTGVDDGS